MSLSKVEKVLIYLFALAIVLGFIATLIQSRTEHQELLTALYAPVEIQENN